MRIYRSILIAGLGLCVALPAAAQYIGVLQSAETNDRGVFKIMVAPIMVFGKDGADDDLGVAARAGYGFTDRFDAEAKVGFFDIGTYVGADGELWLVKAIEQDAGLDASVVGGVHWILGKDNGPDIMGFDLAPLASLHVSPNLELCGALTAAFESIKDLPEGADDSFTRLHLVPGIDYRLSESLDLVGEIGIALNDDSSTYAGAGVAFYLR